MMPSVADEGDALDHFHEIGGARRLDDIDAGGFEAGEDVVDVFEGEGEMTRASFVRGNVTGAGYISDGTGDFEHAAASIEEGHLAALVLLAQGQSETQQIAIEGDGAVEIPACHADMFETDKAAHLSSSTTMAKSSGRAVVYLIWPMAKAELTSVRLILLMSFL